MKYVRSGCHGDVDCRRKPAGDCRMDRISIGKETTLTTPTTEQRKAGYDPEVSVPANRVRWFLPFLDWDRVLLTERLSFTHGRQRSQSEIVEEQLIGCQVAVYESPRQGVVGYVMFFLAPGKRLEIMRFAVQPSARKLGIGQALLNWAIALGVEKSVEKIVCELSEDYAAAQMLLKKVGFRYVETLPDDCKEVDEADMYRFELSTDTMCPKDGP